MGRLPVTIWFSGRPAEAASLLIERLLRSCRLRDLVVVRLEESRASAGVGVRRAGVGLVGYREAGAADVYRLGYVRGAVEEALEALLEQEVACRIAHGLLLESRGARPPVADLAVYVMRPLPPGQTLLARREQEVLRLTLADIMRLSDGDSHSPETDENHDGKDDGEIVEELEATPAQVARITGLDVASAALLLEAAAGGVPIRAARWALHADYEGLEQAQVIVIDARTEHERAAAAGLAGEIGRLRADPEVRRDLALDLAAQRRTSVYVADLANPRDARLKQALARIKRILPTDLDDEDDDW